MIKKFIRECKSELIRRNLKKVGYCCKCGECCKHATGMSFDSNNIHDFKVDRRKKACHQFNIEERICMNHNNKRWVCKCWPMLPEHIEKFSNCTYRFVEEK